ncbi:molybdopterin converting factor subunit 1 [Bacillus aquiflavi]|uniref:Molybdopterin synthase sulfur carrier subunit n=1 Tax=Bacillus aquiflavi TaxID=2672567 RepID=A0A6B3W144_9BACI|nr:molybdopterin converting factor subunit 1 [Bacillus aquiflavi]MBA4537428.1 molybdopterin converting factor subunit 1 [Bacillus aquiflavi]NEY81683.1 molybdopterin converting factor subunit 1 [Bacillus aquiflavi]UAC47976.1 molybdopterin converting factor subunit 1 [Bacillus aquiflavi]
MVKVLFFAHLRDTVGEDYVMIDANGKTISQLKEIVETKYNIPKLDSVMVAINEEFATEDEMIKTGDTVAFIPPVSGG